MKKGQQAGTDASDFTIAFIDIETRPIIGYTWGIYEQDLVGRKQDWAMISFAVKYAGKKRAEVYALPDFPLYKKDKISDYDLCAKLWEVMDGADLVVAHNGDRFDIPKINARLIHHGFNPPSPYKTLDTKKMAKRTFAFTSNKLDDLGSELKLGQKLQTGGFGLWLGCMEGDMKSWKKMKEYNGQDVILLEKLYDRLLPWSPSYVNRNVYDATHDNCPRCGGHKMQSRGFRATTSGRRARLQCQDCGGWAQGGFIKMGVTVR